MERNCVPHIACVSCPSVVAPQCDCSIASMIAHGTHPSRHLACESREPQLVNKGETPVCCNVDWGGSRINRNSLKKQVTRRSHLTSAHHLWQPGTGRRCPHGCLRGPVLSPLPHIALINDTIRNVTPHSMALHHCCLRSWALLTLLPKLSVPDCSRKAANDRVLAGPHLVAITPQLRSCDCKAG